MQYFEGSPHPKEFISTVTGYHLGLIKPESYSTFSILTISGKAYLAITSSACMACGKLSAV